MPRFVELPKELQLKARLLEDNANKLGKEAPETKKLWLEFQKNELVCGALSTKGGAFGTCLRTPEEGRNRCSLHGGRTLKGDEMTPAQKLAHMKNLRPRAVVHGMYSEKSNFIESLTKEEIEYMAYLEEQICKDYEINEGIESLMLEEALLNAISHFRLVNSGAYFKPSKHMAKPLQELLKTAREMGWTRKSPEDKKKQSTSQALSDLLEFAKAWEDDKKEDPKPNIKRIK